MSAADTALEDFLKEFAEQDSFAALTSLFEQNEPQLVTGVLLKSMRQKYWQEKDLPAALTLGRAGIQYGLQAAPAFERSDPGLAHQLRCDAKGFAYDLASFAWSGWAEPGIEITRSDHAWGHDAARTNLRLAVELQRGDLPVSRAHWMLGAHRLAEKRWARAAESFSNAVKFAHKAEAAADEALSRGFLALARLLESDNPETQQQYETSKQELAALEHGDAFVQQLETALGVFSG